MSQTAITRSFGRLPAPESAGRTAVGVCSNSYVSGLSLADCVFSGRRAGRSLVAQAAQQGGTKP